MKNFSNDKLLKNDKNNQKNKNSLTEIFDDENENEKNENVETQIFRKQSISDVADNSKLIKNNSFDLNRENRESHVTSINQKTKKSKNFAISFNQRVEIRVIFSSIIVIAMITNLNKKFKFSIFRQIRNLNSQHTTKQSIVQIIDYEK